MSSDGIMRVTLKKKLYNLLHIILVKSNTRDSYSYPCNFETNWKRNTMCFEALNF